MTATSNCCEKADNPEVGVGVGVFVMGYLNEWNCSLMGKITEWAGFDTDAEE